MRTRAELIEDAAALLEDGDDDDIEGEANRMAARDARRRHLRVFHPTASGPEGSPTCEVCAWLTRVVATYEGRR